MISAPKQSERPYISADCQLLDIATVSSVLNLSAEEIAPKLGYGLEFAFDLRRPKARHAMPRVWRGSVLAYRNGYRPDTRRDAGLSASAESARLQFVLDAVLSIDVHRLSIRATAHDLHGTAATRSQFNDLAREVADLRTRLHTQHSY